jgi:hypothetical protein
MHAGGAFNGRSAESWRLLLIHLPLDGVGQLGEGDGARVRHCDGSVPDGGGRREWKMVGRPSRFGSSQAMVAGGRHRRKDPGVIGRPRHSSPTRRRAPGRHPSTFQRAGQPRPDLPEFGKVRPRRRHGWHLCRQSPVAQALVAPTEPAAALLALICFFQPQGAEWTAIVGPRASLGRGPACVNHARTIRIHQNPALSALPSRDDTTTNRFAAPATSC